MLNFFLETNKILIVCGIFGHIFLCIFFRNMSTCSF
jgi:hypothetical protein